jgi:hypothetical protein
VEAGADTDQLDALAQTLSGLWPEHLQAVLGKCGAQAGQATYSLVRWDKPWAQAAWSDLGETARTRLGLNGVDVSLLQPWQTPLGCVIQGLSLPAWMLPSACEAGPVQAQEGSAGELKFCVTGRWFCYDRLGLRPA